jgi:selenocysteine lyase/cysteine desulfurase
VTGLIQPVAELVALAHSRGARVVVDAAQTVGLLFPLEVGDADAIAFSAHKALRGLPGIGVLLLNEGAPIEPLIVGGSGADALSDEMPAELPDRLEAGTRNLPGIAAFGAAALAAVAKPTTGRSPSAWRDQADALREAVRRSGATVAGPGELPVVAFTMAGHDPQAIEEMLDRVFGIVSRAGLHCAPEAHRTLGTLPLGAVRVSSGATTTDADLDALTTALSSLQSHAGFTDAVLR